MDAEDGTASPARKFGPADAATGWRDPPAADGVEAAPATTLGYGGYGESLPETSPGRGPCCASVNLGCDETAYVTQVDLDRDPRLRSARDDVARARWDDSPTTKDPTSGEVVFDGEALEAATKSPRMRIVEMEERVGGEGFVDEDEGAGESRAREDPVPGRSRRRRGELPATGRLTEARRTRVEAFFRACERVDCRPPRRPFPHDFSQRAAPRAEFYF